MGATIKPSKAMKRGINLESKVIAAVERARNTQFWKQGITILACWPLHGASPDAVNDEFVVEVKCPVLEKTTKNYMNNGMIQPKYNAQI